MQQEHAHTNPWAPFVVQPDAGCDDLKRQYRALARAHHPDHGGDPLVMARINLLYAQLVESESYPHSRLPTPDSRLPTPDSVHPPPRASSPMLR